MTTGIGMRNKYLTYLAGFLFIISWPVYGSLESEGCDAYDWSITSPFSDDIDGSYQANAALIEKKTPLVSATTRIQLDNYPNAFNPSMVANDSGYLLIFRYLPAVKTEPWISYIGIVQLDNKFNPISQPEILDTRLGNTQTPSQSEDARIFRCQNKIYVIYNDNIELLNPGRKERRDMFIAELLQVNGHYVLATPLKVIHEQKYSQETWQKNWVPFEWNNKMMITYTVNPHEVLYADLEQGICKQAHLTQGAINWEWGILRGSSPPLLVDGEYLSFFHSGIITRSDASRRQKMWHYYMGAYTFSAKPPFELTGISPSPIDAKGFYTKSDYDKRVIFPGGFVRSGANLYVAYGKDDREIWIATINLTVLKNSLVKVKPATGG